MYKSKHQLTKYVSKLEDGVDVHKLTQVNKICAKTCTPNCYALVAIGSINLTIRG